ncbi:MAG TPA: hypothetical protein VEI49_10770 [Terriglobales bacterium]|nr:hypothetical protein [Terriglobales bacterium]
MSRSILVLAFLLVPGISARGQRPPEVSADNGNAVLVKKVEELQNQVRDLQQRLDEISPPPPSDGVEQPVSRALSKPEEAPAETNSVDQSAPDVPRLSVQGINIRAFGQAQYTADDLHGDRPDLSIGNLTLLMTSELSNHLSALAELAFDEADYGAPSFSVDVERLLLQYQQSDYFKIAAGRYFTSIGYYNTAFYNADWAQTTMRRPGIVAFMDQGGILPTQRNGVTATGRLSSSELGLHYVAEVGTGDLQRTDLMGDEFFYQARTAYNLAMFVRPERIRGLQAGGSYYHDTILPTANGTTMAIVRQSIYSSYAVYTTPLWECLNEAYLIHHAVVNSRTYNTPAFYSQISRRLTNSIRPYFRYTWINAADSNPVFPDVRQSRGPETGVRYNFSEWVGLKTEYNRLDVRGFPAINLIGSQLVFTF